MNLRSPTREGVTISLAILFTLSGIAALAWPVREDPTTPVQTAALVRPSQSGGVESNDSITVAAIVRANIFSNRLQAPAMRSAPSGSGEVERVAGNQSMAPASDDSSAPARKGASAPRLFGIVASPDGPTALMRLDGVGGSATPYHVGDRGGSFRVVSIGDREVVVDGPGGRRTLHLFDPSTTTKSP